MKSRSLSSSLKHRICKGERISSEEALSLNDWDFHELAAAADLRRKLAWPGKEVGFILDRIINFTNVCQARCSFCAFHARAGRIKAYELSLDEIFSRIEELVAAGGTQVMLQGGLHPGYTLDTYVRLVREVKKRFPGIWLHSFSPAEIAHAAARTSVSLDQVVGALRDAGLDSIPGASDLLVDRIRKRTSPRKIGVSQWVEAMEAIHRAGLKSSATMTFGMGENEEERISHLAVIRDLQDRTGMLRAFIPWSFSPARTRMNRVQPATGIQYLRIVAMARIFLDNVVQIQAGWLTEGMKLAQLALAMGATDLGGVLTEELVVKATGVENRTSMGEMIDIIRNAGRIPVQRDSEYRKLREFR